MADNVKHNIRKKLYELKKTAGEKGVFIQIIISTVHVCPRFFQRNLLDLLLPGRILQQN